MPRRGRLDPQGYAADLELAEVRAHLSAIATRNDGVDPAECVPADHVMASGGFDLLDYREAAAFVAALRPEDMQPLSEALRAREATLCPLTERALRGVSASGRPRPLTEAPAAPPGPRDPPAPRRGTSTRIAEFLRFASLREALAAPAPLQYPEFAVHPVGNGILLVIVREGAGRIGRAWRLTRDGGLPEDLAVPPNLLQSLAGNDSSGIVAIRFPCAPEWRCRRHPQSDVPSDQPLPAPSPTAARILEAAAEADETPAAVGDRVEGLVRAARGGPVTGTARPPAPEPEDARRLASIFVMQLEHHEREAILRELAQQWIGSPILLLEGPGRGEEYTDEVFRQHAQALSGFFRLYGLLGLLVSPGRLEFGDVRQILSSLREMIPSITWYATMPNGVPVGAGERPASGIPTACGSCGGPVQVTGAHGDGSAGGATDSLECANRCGWTWSRLERADPDAGRREAGMLRSLLVDPACMRSMPAILVMNLRAELGDEGVGPADGSLAAGIAQLTDHERLRLLNLLRDESVRRLGEVGDGAETRSEVEAARRERASETELANLLINLNSGTADVGDPAAVGMVIRRAGLVATVGMLPTGTLTTLRVACGDERSEGDGHYAPSAALERFVWLLSVSERQQLSAAALEERTRRLGGWTTGSGDESGRSPEVDPPGTPAVLEVGMGRVLPRNSPEEQIERLAEFIQREIPGEPSRSEGAVETAIRLLRASRLLQRECHVRDRGRERDMSRALGAECAGTPVSWVRDACPGQPSDYCSDVSCPLHPASEAADAVDADRCENCGRRFPTADLGSSEDGVFLCRECGQACVEAEAVRVVAEMGNEGILAAMEVRPSGPEAGATPPEPPPAGGEPGAGAGRRRGSR